MYVVQSLYLLGECMWFLLVVDMAQHLQCHDLWHHFPITTSWNVGNVSGRYVGHVADTSYHLSFWYQWKTCRETTLPAKQMIKPAQRLFEALCAMVWTGLGGHLICWLICQLLSLYAHVHSVATASTWYYTCQKLETSTWQIECQASISVHRVLKEKPFSLLALRSGTCPNCTGSQSS